MFSWTIFMMWTSWPFEQVRGVKPMSLPEMANLFTSLHLGVTPGLVSCHPFELQPPLLLQIFKRWCSLPGYESKQSGCLLYLLFRKHSSHALSGKKMKISVSCCRYGNSCCPILLKTSLDNTWCPGCWGHSLLPGEKLGDQYFSFSGSLALGHI